MCSDSEKSCCFEWHVVIVLINLQSWTLLITSVVKNWCSSNFSAKIPIFADIEMWLFLSKKNLIPNKTRRCKCSSTVITDLPLCLIFKRTFLHLPLTRTLAQLVRTTGVITTAQNWFVVAFPLMWTLNISTDAHCPLSLEIADRELRRPYNV